MKLIVLIVLVLVLGGVLTAGQTSKEQSSETDKVVDAIKLMDRQWIIEAYSSKDLKDFDRIVADDFLITGANGKIQDKAQKRANVKADYTEFAPDAIFKIDEGSAKVRVFGNTAISTGFIIEKYMWKEFKINGHVHFTNTYLKRNGKWQVVASQFTNIKQS
jgi:hypothetical protein